MKVPSGTNTGFKIVENFTIEKEQTLELVLDFDANRSVIQAGNSGQWLIKPTVKIEDLEQASIVKGKVTTDGTNPIPGALVSAQQYNATALDENDKVVVVTSTITDSDGNYALFFAAGTYNLVATVEDRTTDFGKKPTVAGVTYEGEAAVNFQLGTTNVGEVAGTVLIAGAGTENYATLSFRQSANAKVIEVKSINVANGAGYSINLPGGNYTLVASSFNYATKSIPISVTSGATTDGDVAF